MPSPRYQTDNLNHCPDCDAPIPPDQPTSLRCPTCTKARKASHCRDYLTRSRQTNLVAAVWYRKRIRSRQHSHSTPVDADPPPELSPPPTTCPALGIPLEYPGPARQGDRRRRHGDRTASIDQIEPKGGYVQGNVTWLSLRANQIKQAATPDEILKVAAWLYRELAKQGHQPSPIDTLIRLSLLSTDPALQTAAQNLRDAAYPST